METSVAAASPFAVETRGTDQALSAGLEAKDSRGPGPPRPRGQSGRGLRPARSQRLGQKHDAQTSPRPRRRQRRGGARLRPAAREHRSAQAGRLPPREPLFLRLPQRRRDPALLRQDLRCERLPARKEDRGVDRTGRPAEWTGTPLALLLEGHAPAHRPGAGAHPRPRSSLPRRTDGGGRSARLGPDSRPHPPPEKDGQGR